MAELLGNAYVLGICVVLICLIAAGLVLGR